jgi:peptide/nickel transport system substrate-binding protein
MEEYLPKLRRALTQHRRLSFFEDLVDFIRALRPGDRLVFVILSFFILATSISSILALESSILVVEPAYGGSLSEGEVEAPRFINPLLALSTTDQDLTALTYAGLMGTGPQGTLVPVLAQSYIVSPDGRTYQFTLRPSARFSDGSPVTADDVVFTIKKAQDTALKSPQTANWTGITVTAIDARTVQFTLRTPYAPFIYDTTLGILPAHLWRNVTDQEFPFSPLQTKPVGAGPFVPAAITRDAQGDIGHYDLNANPHYALGRPYLDSLAFTFYPDLSSLQTAVQSGKVEAAYGVMGKRVLTAPYSRIFAVFFNTASSTANAPVFAKVSTRQALSEAIDRDSIVKNVFGGYATAATGPVPMTNIASTTPLAGSRASAAATLLSSSGWIYSSTSNIWKDKSGHDLSITLTTSNVPELKMLAQAIQSNWQSIHVPTTLKFYEPGDLSQDVIRPRNYQALLFGMVIGKGTDLYDFWDSKAAANPGLNITNYSNSAVDTLLADLRTQTDPTTRTQELAKVNSLISNDYPAAFIESPDFSYVVPKDLNGVILPLITSPSDRFASVATWYRRSESVWPFLARTN